MAGKLYIPTTVIEYPISGLDYRITFEYLARRFVHVILVDDTFAETELTLGVDYRFATPTLITLESVPTNAVTIKLLRKTSATDRLVDYHDGSILRAYDLNLSQLQTIHIAEEARDGLYINGLVLNSEGEYDARSRNIINLKDGVNSNDAINKKQLDTVEEAHDERLDKLEDTFATSTERLMMFKYNVSNDTTDTIVLPLETGFVRVFINGVRQRHIEAFTFDKNVVTFSEPLDKGDIVDFELGTEPMASSLNEQNSDDCKSVKLNTALVTEMRDEVQQDKETVEGLTADSKVYAEETKKAADTIDATIDSKLSEASDAIVTETKGYANNAQSAADAAAASGKIYNTVEDGIAATPLGGLFLVVSTKESGFSDLYLNYNGTGVYQNKTTKAYMKSKDKTLIFLDKSDSQLCVADGLGRVGFNVTDKGAIETAILNLNGKTTEQHDDGLLIFSAKSTKNEPMVIADGLGRVSPTEEEITNKPIPVIPVGMDTELNNFFTYGQSLAVGHTYPLISKAPSKNNYMYQSRMVPQYSYAEQTAKEWFDYLVPSHESDEQTLSETPSSGTGDMVEKLLHDENHIDFGHSLILSALGMGATPIDGLTKYSEAYNRLTAHHERSKVVAADMGKTYKARAVSWIQGEANIMHHMPEKEYTSKMVKLASDLAVDLENDDLKLISYQVSSHAGYNVRPDIALAQSAAMNQSRNIVVACSMFNFDYSDQFHLQGDSSRKLGGYIGLAYKRLVLDKIDWKPMHIVSAEKVNPRTISVKLHVPFGEIVIDTDELSEVAGYGFDIDGLTITSVTVATPNSLTLVFSSDIPEKATLTYAWKGIASKDRNLRPHGNIRDSQGEKIKFNTGFGEVRMDNWLLISEVEVI